MLKTLKTKQGGSPFCMKVANTEGKNNVARSNNARNTTGSSAAGTNNNKKETH